MKSLNQLISEDFRFLIFERTAEPLPFNRTHNSNESITYEFIVSGKKYEFNLTLKSEGYGPATYEAVFMKDGQKSSSERGGKNPFDTFKILATCKAIMDKECREKKIRTYHIEGAKDEEQITKQKGDSEEDTQRARVYEKFFNTKYGSNAVKRNGRFITIDMTQVFPKVFKDESNSKVSTISNLLLRVSDKNPDKEAIMQSFEGNENTFSVATDELINSKYGGLDLDMYIDNVTNQYKVSFNKFDIGQHDEKSFNDFKPFMQYVTQNLT